MIYAITTHSDPIAALIKDDPVRPHIPIEQRFDKNCQVLALKNNDAVNAIVCAKLCVGVPDSEQQLLSNSSDNPDTVVFYTIWSYSPGAGQQLINEGLAYVKQTLPQVTKFVTLSPPTEMARRFHLKNGASIYRVNNDSVNYEYTK